MDSHNIDDRIILTHLHNMDLHIHFYVHKKDDSDKIFSHKESRNFSPIVIHRYHFLLVFSLHPNRT